MKVCFRGIESGDIDKTVADFMRGYIEPRQAIITKPLKARLCIDGEESELSLSVIPSSPGLVELEASLSSYSDRESYLKKAIAKIEDDFDHILFDCSPSFGLITVNALKAADKVFIPVQTEYLALRSLEELIRRIEEVMAGLNSELVIGGLIATRFDKRKVLGRHVVESLRELYGGLLLNTVIRENIVLAESPRFGKDIFSYRPRSNGAHDYLNLALEIMGRVTAAENLFSVERGVITGKKDDGDIFEGAKPLEQFESLR